MPPNDPYTRTLNQLPPAPQSHWSTLLPWIGGAISDTLAPQQQVWNDVAKVQTGRELTPLSVSQIPEPYQRSLASPEQWMTGDPISAPSSVPSYQPSALDFSLQKPPVQPPSQRLQGPFQFPSPPSPTVPSYQSPLQPPMGTPPAPHLQAEQGPNLTLNPQVLNPQAPANPAQREYFASDVARQARPVYGQGAAMTQQGKWNMAYQSAIYSGATDEQARDIANRQISGLEHESRLREGLVERVEQRGRALDQGDRRLDLQEKAQRENLQAVRERLRLLKGSQDLALKKYELDKAWKQVLGAIYQVQKDPGSMDEETQGLLKNSIMEFIAEGYDVTQYVSPNFLNQWGIPWPTSQPKTHITKKPQSSGAPQGAPSTGGQQGTTRQYQGKTYFLPEGKENKKENWIVQP